MCRRGNKIGKKEDCLTPAGKARAHHIAVVARDADQLDSRNDFGISLREPTIAPDSSMGMKFSGK